MFVFKEYFNLEVIFNDDRYKTLTYNALNFICKEKGAEKEFIDCKLILTEDFKKVFAQYHFKADAFTDSNGVFIPIYYQNEETKKYNRDIILINMGKLKKNSSDYFIASVIVHEINHYLVDKEIYPNLKEKYNLYLGAKNKEPKMDYIAGLYQGYSEIYSKYYQEKYWINNNPRILLDEHIKNWREILPKIQNEQDFYSMFHIVGMIRCWEDLIRNDKDLELTVSRIKKFYFKLCKPIKAYIYDMIDKKNFLNLCENVYTDEINTINFE